MCGAPSRLDRPVATVLAGDTPSATVLINGGEIAYSDVERSLAAGRSVLAVAGSGRTADDLAAALRGDPADERAVALAESDLVQAVPAENPSRLAHTLAAALTEPTQGESRPAGHQPRIPEARSGRGRRHDHRRGPRYLGPGVHMSATRSETA